MFFNLTTRGIFALTLGLSAVAAQANLLTDGSFEALGTTVGVGAGQAQTLSGGNTYGAWTAVGVGVDLLSTTYAEPQNGMSAFNAEDGKYSIDLTGPSNSGTSSGISQFASTVIGTSYTLTFWVGAANSSTGSSFYTGPAAAGLMIDSGGVTQFTNSTFSTGSGTDVWQKFSYTFVATKASTDVTFYNRTSTPTNFCGLDNLDLEVTPAPEPCSTMLVLGSVAFIARRFRRA